MASTAPSAEATERDSAGCQSQFIGWALWTISCVLRELGTMYPSNVVCRLAQKVAIELEKTSILENEYEHAGAGDGIKPGVERSETPGIVAAIIHSSRSGRQWKY
jgi:hypothetical protein